MCYIEHSKCARISVTIEMTVEHTHVFLGFRTNAGDISAP